MKNVQIAKLFKVAGLALAATGLATIALAADPIYKAVGDDGIAASPRLRAALNEKAAGAAMTERVATMSCPKCSDVLVRQAKPQAKGAEVLAGVTQVTVKHGCDACTTTATVVGTGKATKTVATHECLAPVADKASCCKPIAAK